MLLTDKLSYRSKLRYVNASEKLLYAAATLAFCVLSRSMKMAVLVFAVNAAITVGKGGISLSRYVKLLLIPAAFLVMGTAAIVVNLSRVPLDAFAFQAGQWYITGSRAGIGQAAEICMTAMAAVSCLYFLALSTVMTDILGALRKLKVPALMIELMLLVYRFIFVLSETASAIRVSQNSRLGNRNLRTGIRSFGAMGSALFVLALKRSNALYDAMESRCYDGTVRVLSKEHPAKTGEIALIVLYEALLAAIWLLGI